MSREQSASMRVRVNGQWRELTAPVAVAGVLQQLGLGALAPGIAVAVNDVLVPRSQWEARALVAGDQVEVVGAVQGG